MEILGKLRKMGQYDKGLAMAKVLSSYSKMSQNVGIEGEGVRSVSKAGSPQGRFNPAWNHLRVNRAERRVSRYESQVQNQVPRM